MELINNMDDMIITVDNLQKSYKDVPVLKGVNFSVKRGSIFTLLGSNGAGKTTTVKILSTLMAADRGDVFIDGVSINESRKVKEKISLTGQYASVDEALSGRENMDMICALRGVVAEKKELIERLLTQFELSKSADRKVSTYSGGMRRKLDIAMSLIGNPAVIFLDEPTTGLDPQSRLVLWEIIKALAEAGTTIFLTTQYLEEAERLADYIAILNEGTIIAEGTVEALRKSLPSHVITFSFESLLEMEKALNLLQDYQVRNSCSDKDAWALAVAVSDGIDQLRDILNILQENSVKVLQFEQNTPTLEDVFLNLINEKEVEII